MKPIAWIGIGCAVVLVVGIAAFAVLGVFVWNKASDVVEDFSDNPAAATAETFVRLNPDLELVESDREAGRITVRQTSTGEVGTFDYEEMKEGRFSFESADGEKVSFDATSREGVLKIESDEGTTTYGTLGRDADLPGWLPPYENVEGDVGGFTQVSDESRSGTISFETSDDLDEVIAFYEEVLAELDIEPSRGDYSAGDTRTMTLGGSSDTHDLQVGASRAGDLSRVQITFRGPA